MKAAVLVVAAALLILRPLSLELRQLTASLRLPRVTRAALEKSR